MSTRSQVVAAIEAALKTRVTTVSGRVFRWRKKPFDLRELPAIHFMDAEGVSIPGTIGMAAYEMKVSVIYCAASGSTTASQATTALGEVSAALFADYTLGGVADSLEIVKHDIMTAQEGDVIGAALVEIIVTYTAPYGAI